MTRCLNHISPYPNSPFLSPFGCANPEELIAGSLRMDIRVTYIPPFQVSFYHHSYGNRSLHRLLSQTSRGSKISYPHYCSHCQNGRSLFPIPYSLDANATRGISKYPLFCLFGRAEELIAGVDWALDIRVTCVPFGLLFHRSFHFFF